MQSVSRILMAEPAILYTAAMFILLWFASFLNVPSFWLFVIAFLFLIQVDKNRMKKVKREIRNEERRSASQFKPLSDFESASWINQALEKIWPQFLQEFISKEVLKPILPWFIDKHMPWTVKKATLQHLDMGRQPPKFRGVRTLTRPSGDDHLVMDFCLDFAAADDMTAVLSVQMAKSVGLGITTNIHISRLHIEGKVRIGIKFSKSWPFISRARLCFENAPYVQLTARPLSTHGVDVSELPLIAGWMERMVADVFEQSLVEPNMLVLDVTKLATCLVTSKIPNSTSLITCLDIHEREAIATMKLHILEAAELKPSDFNGLADPYVKGSFNSHRFRTKVHKKTLTPQWYEEFKVPIASWELPTALVLHVRDKDQFRDDDLGFCEIDIARYRGGQHHDLWIPLQDIKMGRVHVTLEIIENVPESQSSDEAKSNTDEEEDKSLLTDKFEIINLGKGENDGFLSVVSPGQPTKKGSWQQREATRRHGRARKKTKNLESIHSKPNGSSSSELSGDEDEVEDNRPKRRGFWGRRSHQVPSTSVAKDDKSSLENGNVYTAVGAKGTTVKMNVEANKVGFAKGKQSPPEESTSPEANIASEKPGKRNQMKTFAKGVFKQAEKTAYTLSGSLKKRSKKGLDDNSEGSETPEPSASAGEVEAKVPVESELDDKNQSGEVSKEQNYKIQ